MGYFIIFALLFQYFAAKKCVLYLYIHRAGFCCKRTLHIPEINISAKRKKCKITLDFFPISAIITNALDVAHKQGEAVLNAIGAL